LTTRNARSSDASAAALALLMGVVLAPAAHAQELEPRAYSNLPMGLNFLATGYAHSQGGLSTDPSLPLTDAHLKIDTGVVAYVRGMDLWGNSGKFDVIVPYSHLSGTALVAGQPRERDISGAGDPRFRLSVNFYGAPALTLAQYPAYKPDVGFSKAFAPFTVDLTAGITLFTRNDDYFGGQTLDQAPIYSAQVNLSYDFGRGIWAAFGATFYRGGRTTLNDISKEDALSNSRMGLTVAVPIDRYYAIKFNASSGISTRTGTSFDTVGVVLQYRWGAGL
jgi:hypothetical protein